MMINKIIGIFLVGVSVTFYGYWYSNPGFTADSLFWLKMVASGLAGLGVLIYESIPIIKNIKLPTRTNTFTVSNLESKDFEAMTYLKKRLKSLNSKEGLKSLQELNNILFKMDIDYAENTSDTRSDI